MRVEIVHYQTKTCVRVNCEHVVQIFQHVLFGSGISQ